MDKESIKFKAVLQTIGIIALTTFIMFVLIAVTKFYNFQDYQFDANQKIKIAINSLHKTDSDQCDWVTITDEQFETAFGGKPVSITTGETPKRIHFYSCKNY